MNLLQTDARFLLPKDADARLAGYPATVAPGLRTRVYAALPSLDQPVLYVPTDSRRLGSYVLRTWTFPKTRIRAIRKHVFVRAAPQVLARRKAVTVISPRRQPLFVETAAEAFQLGRELDSFLVSGQGDDLARGVFVVFDGHAAAPSWIVKFSRAPGYVDPFDRDARGLALAAAAGGSVAARAPRLIGRFTAAGHEASVETAAVGSSLSGVLGSAGSRARKLELVDSIAEWIIGAGVATQCESVRDELERLERDVVPRWSVDRRVLAGLDRVRGVLQHNDLGAWNVVSERAGSFSVLDWESAQPCGLPLWDLWYFLADALPLVDGKQDEPPAAFRQLFRGDAPSSQHLFAWTRRAVEALGVPAELVGGIATLCWLHHGLSHHARTAALQENASDPTAHRWPPEHYPRIWLDDPRLGVDWQCWHGTAAVRRAGR
jgi:hypothetical protein